jgi:hypothetical protein
MHSRIARGGNLQAERAFCTHAEAAAPALPAPPNTADAEKYAAREYFLAKNSNY